MPQKWYKKKANRTLPDLLTSSLSLVSSHFAKIKKRLHFLKSIKRELRGARTCQSREGSLTKTSMVLRRRSQLRRSARRLWIIVPSNNPFCPCGCSRLRIWLVSLIGMSPGTGRNCNKHEIALKWRNYIDMYLLHKCITGLLSGTWVAEPNE